VRFRGVDLTGRRFGRLVVLGLGPRGRRGVRKWLCRCDCGTEKPIRGGALTWGETVSCGCFQREQVAALARRRSTHGHAARGAASRTYKTWNAMLQRCTNPKSPNWARYGGRGIAVCRRWYLFENFLADMGERPPGKSIDRYPDKNGNYEPSSCRWATAREQLRNTRRNKWLTVGGEPIVLTEAASRAGISINGLKARLAKGWSPDDAATAPTDGPSRDATSGRFAPRPTPTS